MCWGSEELQDISFGDTRLDLRSGGVLTNLGDNPSFSIPAASSGWADTKATYNFFNNEKVDKEKILSSHKQSIIERTKDEGVLLSLQDTTELDYTGQKQNDAHGLLNLESRKGTYLHNTLITTPSRLPLGIWHISTIKRDKLRNQMSAEEKKKHDQSAYIEKESYRWYDSYQSSCELAEIVPDKQVISIGDRENDSYNFISSVQESINSGKPYADFIIRGSWDRKVQLANGDETRLNKELEKQSPIAKINFILPARNGAKAREVTQSVKVKTVNIKPTSQDNEDANNIEITAILLTETSPPNGAEPIKWMLLTNIKTNTKEEVLDIVKYYLCRWDIEMLFKILKSGCKVEELQIGSQGIENCLAIYLIVSWRIMYITMLGRNCPDMPCNVVFTEFEWNAVYIASKKETPPKEIPSLQTIITLIASLGGFLNRKHDGDPGIKVMWIGMQRMTDMALILEINNSITKKSQTYG